MLALIAVLASGCYLRHERPVDCDAGVLCNACVEGTCNHDTGEGCAEGEGCYFVDADPETGTFTTGCLPTRSRPVGSACTTSSDCESGHTCLTGSESSRPVFCIPTCCGGAGCPSGMECLPTRVRHSDTDAGVDAGPGAWARTVGACIWPPTACDVLQQTGCPGGQACYLGPMPLCRAPGALRAGASCLDLADCAPGLACIAEHDGTAVCRRFCRVDHECESGECDRSEPLWAPGVGICR